MTEEAKKKAYTVGEDFIETDAPILEITRYGFEWDQIEVTRVSAVEGQKILIVQTPKEFIVLRITKTGLIRIDSHTKIAQSVK